MSEYKYQSPIEMIQGEMGMHMDGEILKAVQNVGINVDKDELLKALAYDRDQYNKGYNDGKPKVGRWIRWRLGTDDYAYYGECSNCKGKVKYGTYKPFEWCPYCGAKMEGE